MVKPRESEAPLFPSTVPAPWDEFNIAMAALEGRYEQIAVPELKALLKKLTGRNAPAGEKKEDLVLELVEILAGTGVVPAEVLERALSVPRGVEMPSARPVNKGGAKKKGKREEKVWEHEGLFLLVLSGMIKSFYMERAR